MTVVMSLTNLWELFMLMKYVKSSIHNLIEIKCNDEASSSHCSMICSWSIAY